jgi:hypothetical protein
MVEQRRKFGDLSSHYKGFQTIFSFHTYPTLPFSEAPGASIQSSPGFYDVVYLSSFSFLWFALYEWAWSWLKSAIVWIWFVPSKIILKPESYCDDIRRWHSQEVIVGWEGLMSFFQYAFILRREGCYRASLFLVLCLFLMCLFALSLSNVSWHPCQPPLLWRLPSLQNHSPQ